MMNEIKTYNLSQLEDLTSRYGQPKFRAKQLYEWLVGKHAISYDEMTNLPKDFRAQLAQDYPLATCEVIDRQVSKDGTRKYVVCFHDGCMVETVAMPTGENDERLTVCFSTQVGCAMECAFCATGREGFCRNLTANEMTEQVSLVERDFGRRVTNLVAMGQGEPFLNYDALIEALRMANSADSFNIGARHITVSTCGIIPGIDQLAEEPEQFTLAISLHSAIQEKRDQLMPRVSHQPLPSLKKSLKHYVEKTNRRVSFEYLLIKGVNDGEEDLQALLDFCDGLLCHVNLLPMNKIAGSPFQPSPRYIADHWISTLGKHHIEATMRRSRGSDIAGACGQLKNSLQNVSRETI
ncbi:23S rRNA (adenine(2503)-C(2))-methyltransferase RlmN [Adlercreutzia faecimuris]|uniref:Probable dual-specificity RNA methyltransferase RlmN n=1 Tax=Adlercreutzia faecimuris TaxID=2897341 RepID=A0ABS9WDH3_9ACTN|nr:23S rRNA (adenine(2503)-C(2))-methyltransferase RlmN [Adlercreutzia sp. JBNU-10]MCI2240913.1 23S rRNA (adenine(2503)-C(2))-methyltransferase RlmN [Adlercreutzia sp. JBNU-10]